MSTSTDPTVPAAENISPDALDQAKHVTPVEVEAAVAASPDDGGQPSALPVEGTVEASEDAAVAAPAAAPGMSPAACARELKTRFPALFGDQFKPLKLRIQADIQERAPGVFTKKSLSIFLHRHTGATGYIVALSKSKNRFDLDGQPAGELAQEHRDAAVEELKRRRSLNEERRALEDEQRRNRGQLLRDFEHTTLTRPNFCALKGVADEALDGLLEMARKEAAEWAARRPAGGEPRRDARGPRPEGRGPRRDGEGAPRGDRGPRRPQR
jgi:ProP effector